MDFSQLEGEGRIETLEALAVLLLVIAVGSGLHAIYYALRSKSEKQEKPALLEAVAPQAPTTRGSRQDLIPVTVYIPPSLFSESTARRTETIEVMPAREEYGSKRPKRRLVWRVGEYGKSK